MKKWTTTGPNTCGVSLQQILDSRSGPLNDIECWALIGQLCVTLKENIVSHNAKATLLRSSSLSSHLPNFIVTPRTVRCTRIGRIILLPYSCNSVQQGFEDIDVEYKKMSGNLNIFNEDPNRYMTSLGLLSVAKTALYCLSSKFDNSKKENHSSTTSSQSISITSFLLNLIQNYQNISLQDVQCKISSNWSTLVGKTPTSQFVSQLCKVTMGWNNSIARQNRIYSSISLRRNISQATHGEHMGVSNTESSETIVSQVKNPSTSIKFFDDLMNEEGTNETSITPLCTSSPTRNKKISSSNIPDLSNNNNYFDQNSITHTKENNHIIITEKSEKENNVKIKEYEETVSNGINRKETNKTSDMINLREKGQYGRRLDYKPSGCVSRSIGGTQKTVTNMHQFYNSMLSSSSSTSSTSSQIEHFQTPSRVNQIQSQTIQRLPSVAFEEKDLNKEASLKMITTKLAEDVNDDNERSTKKRKCVQRNPSRLYRVVKPLTEVTSIPSPATKRCVGPEFVVMSSELESIRLDLCVRNTRRDADMVAGKEIEIVMLNGQKFVVQVNPSNITAGEVLDNILREQDIKESAMFALAVLQDDEYMPLANDVKLNKVAPLGWRETGTVAPRSLRSGNGSNLLFRQEKVFTLFQRFKFWPRDIDQHLKDPKNKHQLYLQMRRDLLENRYRMTATEHFTLAGMALQVEFGDFSEDIHGGTDSYFMIEHYLPQHIIYEIGKEQSRQCLKKVHRAHIGKSQSKTELKFCHQIQQLDIYGFHLFNVSTDKSSSRRASSDFLLSDRGSNQPMILGIHIEGIFLFESGPKKDQSQPHKMTSSHFWHKVDRIEYDKTRFQVIVQNDADSELANTNKLGEKNVKKLKFYVSEHKAKFLFDLSSAHHQYSNRQKIRDNQRIEIATRTPNKTTNISNSDQISSHTQSTDVKYKGPQGSIRSLKSKLFLSRRNISQRKLYTNGTGSISRPRARSQSRDRDSLSSRCRRLSGRLMSNGKALSPTSNEKQLPKSPCTSEQSKGYMVKRLAHYTSMADALLNPKTPITSRYTKDINDLNTSDKENATPNSKYRYKFYLEPEEDENVQKRYTTGQKENSIKPPSTRIPLQERPIVSTVDHFINMNKLATSTTPGLAEQQSDVGNKQTKKSSRRSHGGGLTADNGNRRFRMGTRLSLSALHRERLRLTSEIGSLLPTISIPSSSANNFSNQMMSNFEDITMETKSLFDKDHTKPIETSIEKGNAPTAYVIHASVNDSQVDIDSAENLRYTTEDIDESLNEKFDAMETDGPERKIVSVTLSKDANGRLGLKITGTPAGIYVEDLDTQSIHGGNDHTERSKLKQGDRILAINGRDLTNVSYHNALDLIKRSRKDVEFVVSQISTR